MGRHYYGHQGLFGADRRGHINTPQVLFLRPRAATPRVTVINEMQAREPAKRRRHAKRRAFDRRERRPAFSRLATRHFIEIEDGENTAFSQALRIVHAPRLRAIPRGAARHASPVSSIIRYTYASVI